MNEREINPVLDISDVYIPIDTEGLFGNKNPLALEIGFGDGDFLIETAEVRSEVNFIGIEVKKKRFNKAVRNAGKKNLANVKFLHMDANIALTEVFRPDTFDEIYINFPDPWPKDKHEKNRILNTGFLLNLSAILKNSGRLEIASDHKSYIESTLETLKPIPLYINNNPPPGYRSEIPGRIETKFEKEFREEGREIYYLMFTNRK